MGSALCSKDSATTCYSVNKRKEDMLHSIVICFTGIAGSYRLNSRLGAAFQRPQFSCQPWLAHWGKEQLRLTDPRKGGIITSCSSNSPINNSSHATNGCNPANFHIANYSKTIINGEHININFNLKPIASNQRASNDSDIRIPTRRFIFFRSEL